MENEMKKRLCVVTSTRADWGLLSPVCRALRDRGLLRIDIVATNMHLIERYGNTYREIEADGFDIACRVPCCCWATATRCLPWLRLPP